MLVDGVKERAGLTEEDGLGAVAVVDIEVIDGHALRARGEGFEHGDGDLVQVAEAHCAIAQGVVAGRAQEAEGHSAFAREGERTQSTADGAEGVFVDAGVRGRVSVEGVGGGLHSGEVVLCVRAEEGFIGHVGGLVPRELELLLAAELLQGARDALRPFWVAGRVVVDAAVVGDDVQRHALGNTGDLAGLQTLGRDWDLPPFLPSRRKHAPVAAAYEETSSRTLRYDPPRWLAG